MLIRMYQIEISKNDKLLKRFNWGGTELLTLSSQRVVWDNFPTPDDDLAFGWPDSNIVHF